MSSNLQSALAGEAHQYVSQAPVRRLPERRGWLVGSEKKAVRLLDKWQAVDRATNDRRLNTTDVCVFFRLLYHHNSQTGACFPSQETLGGALGKEPRTIRNSLNNLEEAGYIRKLRQRHNGGSNNYLLNIFGAEEFFQTCGRKLPERRKKTSDDTKKERGKETREIPNEECHVGTQSKKASIKQKPSRSPEQFQNSMASSLGRHGEGWELMMKAPEGFIEKLEASFLDEEISLGEARSRLLKEVAKA